MNLIKKFNWIFWFVLDSTMSMNNSWRIATGQDKPKGIDPYYGPNNPIRCYNCNRIVGSQALHNHIAVSHPDEYKSEGHSKRYDEYCSKKENKVKKSDLNHPIRAEWRRQNNIPE